MAYHTLCLIRQKLCCYTEEEIDIDKMEYIKLPLSTQSEKLKQKEIVTRGTQQSGRYIANKLVN